MKKSSLVLFTLLSVTLFALPAQAEEALRTHSVALSVRSYANGAASGCVDAQIFSVEALRDGTAEVQVNERLQVNAYVGLNMMHGQYFKVDVASTNVQGDA